MTWQRCTPLTSPSCAGAQIPPESVGCIKFLVTANKDALLFSRHAWTAQLVYKGVVIQTASRRLKVAARVGLLHDARTVGGCTPGSPSLAR